MSKISAISAQFDKDVTYGKKPTDTKILHIGATSRFFRAHWTDYVSDLLEIDPTWGISAAALGHSEDSVQKLENLAKFDNEYGLMAQGAGTPEYKVIRSVTKNTSAPGNDANVMNEFANPKIEIVSLTITDPGYCRSKEFINPTLNIQDAMIIHDIEELQRTQSETDSTPQIKSAMGIIVAGLRERMRKDLDGIITSLYGISSDNGELSVKVLILLSLFQIVFYLLNHSWINMLFKSGCCGG